MLDEIDIDALSDPANGAIEELFYMTDEVARWVGSDELVTTPRDAIHELSFVNALPLYVVLEGVAADTSVNGVAIDPSIEEFVEYMIEVVRTDGGWFGVDAEVPLDDAIWIEIDGARSDLPDAVADLNEIFAASPLVEYDAWMRELEDSYDPPPAELTEVVAWADELFAEVLPVIDELIVDDRVRVDDELQNAQDERRFLLFAAIALALLAVLALLIGWRLMQRTLRRAHEQAAMATRDALTGVGNRHEMDVRSRPNARDPRFGHHVVVMIDIDGFKRVNDEHGHAAGDALLIEVASRLSELATLMVADRPSAAYSVVRLGGDEFMLALHGVRAFDVEGLRHQVDVMRTASIEFEQRQIALEFSVGIECRTGQQELADMVNDADAAAYEDKAERVRLRRAREHRHLSSVDAISS